jgi:type I restriction enzyme R subunit
MTHYRIQASGKSMNVLEDSEGTSIEPASDLGSGKGRDDKEEYLSELVSRLNDVFGADGLTDADMINYVHTIADKIRENGTVMDQLKNNSREQALLGDFEKAAQDAILESRSAHEKQAMRVLSQKSAAKQFFNLLLNLLTGDFDEAG